MTGKHGGPGQKANMYVNYVPETERVDTLTG
jgi:hypothetical protein